MAVAPGSKAFRHFDVADVFSSIGMIRLLQRQGFIEHKPTSASEAAHQQRLLPVGYQFKLVSLQALHDGSLYCVLHHDAIGHVYPGPEVTINVPAARKRSFLILRTRFARGGEFARFSGLEENKRPYAAYSRNDPWFKHQVSIAPAERPGF